MAIYLVTMWFPFTRGNEAVEIAAKITKLPPYITKWTRLNAVDGRKGAKVYNIIYCLDDKTVEAGLFVSKVASMYYGIEGFSWKIEPVMSVRDTVKVQGVKLE